MIEATGEKPTERERAIGAIEKALRCMERDLERAEVALAELRDETETHDMRRPTNVQRSLMP